MFMSRSFIKRIKRVMFMRLRRPFALTQFVLILLILYLCKRTRDRHKRAESAEWIHGDSIAHVDHAIDVDGGVDLFEDSPNGVKEAEGEVGKLFDAVRNKRLDLFPKPEEGIHDQAAESVDTVGEVPKQPVFISSQGAVPLLPLSDNVQQGIGAAPPSIQPGIEAALDQSNVPAAAPADNIAAPEQGAATYHFPVPGEEVPMGALDAVPVPVQNNQAPDVVYDEFGLEIIPRPLEMTQLNPMRFSLEITEDMINRFSVKLPPLLPNFKNPCWEEEIPDDFTYDDSFFNTCHYIPHTNKLKHGAQFKAFERILLNRTTHGVRTRIRCFPYFFLIGVGKCGTTDVFDTLKKYFWELAPVFLKEPHYWEWKRCIDKLICRGQQRTPTFAEYLDSFDSAADFVKEKKMIGPDGNPFYPLMIGDFTPSTLAFHPCWKLMPGNEGRQEPRYINAHYIKALRPQTKFITIMRDPVERVFSNFRMHDRMSGSQDSHSDAQTFHDEMVEVMQYLSNCMKYKTARSCAHSIMKFDFGTHVTNSMYDVFISDWLKIFPKDQFLFLRMEDYMEDRVPNFRRIVQFLELDPMPPEKEMMIGSKSVTNQAPPAAMFNETRTLLQDFYRPFNRRLAEILGDDGWNWGY